MRTGRLAEFCECVRVTDDPNVVGSGYAASVPCISKCLRSRSKVAVQL